MDADSRTDIWNADRLWREERKLMTRPVQILHRAVMIMPFRVSVIDHCWI